MLNPPPQNAPPPLYWARMANNLVRRIRSPCLGRVQSGFAGKRFFYRLFLAIKLRRSPETKSVQNRHPFSTMPRHILRICTAAYHNPHQAPFAFFLARKFHAGVRHIQHHRIEVLDRKRHPTPPRHRLPFNPRISCRGETPTAWQIPEKSPCGFVDRRNRRLAPSS